MNDKTIAIIMGSAPSALQATGWQIPETANLVVINNAWRIRPDWDYLIHAGDFPEDRRPENILPGQNVISYESYVPAQNRNGGFVYAGGTMAFTAGYWALDALKPDVLAFFGCDMVYSGTNSHFYGNGQPDPLRDDVTLRSLEAKSARLMVIAARKGCACLNLSANKDSRLVFPRCTLSQLSSALPPSCWNHATADQALAEELELGYMVEDGEYWHHQDMFNADALARIDALWLRAYLPSGQAP